MPIEYFTFESVENITTIAGFAEWTNSMTNYMVGPVILLVFFCIGLLSLYFGNHKSPESIAAVFWATSIVAIVMALIPNFLAGELALATIIISGLVTVLLYNSN